MFLSRACVVLGLLFGGSALALDEGASPEALQREGHFAEAYAAYTNVLLAGEGEPSFVGEAVACLRRVNRVAEADDLLEAVAVRYVDDWRMLASVAESYLALPHQGNMIDGAYVRGEMYGRGRAVNSALRDRTRALQLLDEARGRMRQDDERSAETSELLRQYAAVVKRVPVWRLQVLTDLSELPPFEDGYYYHEGESRAPAGEDGAPVFFDEPASFAAAMNDGERWRALLAEAVAHDPECRDEVLLQRADFAHSLFGVQTLADYGWLLRGMPADDEEVQHAKFAVQTLADDEALARLASGVRRFDLPSDWNFVALYRELANDDVGGDLALGRLAEIFENRRQYAKAGEFWSERIVRFGDPNGHKRARLERIVDPQGTFESMMPQPAGKPAELLFRFRNADEVKLEAREVDVPQLLTDIQTYLEDDPGRLDYGRVNLHDLGRGLVEGDLERYAGDVIASWREVLAPRAGHLDRRVTLETPLSEAGAYWVTAEVPGGQRSAILVWVMDTVIVKKAVDGGTLLFVADAATGQPLEGVTLELFGYRSEFLHEAKLPFSRRHRTHTERVVERTDAEGMVMLRQGREEFDRYQWLIRSGVRRKGAAADEAEYDRFAFLGFAGIRQESFREKRHHRQTGVVITDRPMYRPGHVVNLKVWLGEQRYDLPLNEVPFAGKQVRLEVKNPRHETIWETTVAADEYGGVAGVVSLDEEAVPGFYRILVDGGRWGSGMFRVEEYRKPEFEVEVEGPEDPVKLGDAFEVKVKASYLFGGAVKSGIMRIKVQREAQHTIQYPVGPWDWLYGNGYGWLSPDHAWYPGWRRWGCPAPGPWWMPASQEPPELVAEYEQPVAADGETTIKIDTALAAAMHGDVDHRYTITAEVTDRSRRTITGVGTVVAAREPFRVWVGLNRGYGRVGEALEASISARAPDGRQMTADGVAKLYRVRYDLEGEPDETIVMHWPVTVSPGRSSNLVIRAAEPGQYRLAVELTSRGVTVEGGQLFSVIGSPGEGGFRFNALELIPEQEVYQPDDVLRLKVNTDAPGSAVVLLLRPVNGVAAEVRMLALRGQSEVVEVPLTEADSPNFFVEAFTIHDGRLHSVTREILVPPQSRLLQVEVLPDVDTVSPGGTNGVKVRVTDMAGEPVVGAVALSVYDQAIDLLAGGSNVSDIRKTFWDWRRHHYGYTQSSLDRAAQNQIPKGSTALLPIGMFGHLAADAPGGVDDSMMMAKGMPRGRGGMLRSEAMPMAAISSGAGGVVEADSMPLMELDDVGDALASPPVVVRERFADTAFWDSELITDSNGGADVTFRLPDDLTTWQVRCWSFASGTRVGQGAAEFVATKDLLVRLQSPRFLVEKDEAVLSAIIHNKQSSEDEVEVSLLLDGSPLAAIEGESQTVRVAAGADVRVDWRVRAVREGQAIVRMQVVGKQASDAVQRTYPVYVHGMLKTESFSAVLRPDEERVSLAVEIPAERRPEASRLTLRISPTLAGAMLDALPYLIEYPYGCTEQTLNRFLPAVLVRKVLEAQGMTLEMWQDRQTNLNAGELGDAAERLADWERLTGNVPVFEADRLDDIVKTGLQRLERMQNPDGGWGWFYGAGERSGVHTTAVVVRGLLAARDAGVVLFPGMLEQGLAWLRAHQDEQLRRLNLDEDQQHYKPHADNQDAMVFAILTQAGVHNSGMQEHLYADRLQLSAYGQALLALALVELDETDLWRTVKRNIEQVLVTDDENQTAWLNLRRGWFWYGSEIETQAAYLMLLTKTEPESAKTAGLVKYLLNNRRHATYWDSTRDTALVIESMSAFLAASGEIAPDMRVRALWNGEVRKEWRITPENWLFVDNELVLSGDPLTSGAHTVTVEREGTGPVYVNAFVENFTQEDPITAAGLEVKVSRKVYRLIRDDRDRTVAGDTGQAVFQREERYRREVLSSGARLQSGDLLEIELRVESKNDYEYIIVEDMKAAGCEPVDQLSGYTESAPGAYMELRDERVAFFVRRLGQGTHSYRYRLRAETPGVFSALPTKVSAMYAPELKANSHEWDVEIEDRPTRSASVAE